MANVIVWLLVIEVIGLLALPIAFSFLRFLPERGYTLSKVIGLLIAGYLVWFLGMVGLPFTRASAWLITVVGLGGLSLWLLLRDGRKFWAEMSGFFRSHALFVVGVELLFIVAYFYLLNMRSYVPDIRGTEKPMDFALMNTMVMNDKLPPEDPWMSGNSINYYYFGYFFVAMLTKMSGIEPSITFNLAVSLIFALLIIGTFGVVYNLVGAVRGKKGLPNGLAGLAGSLFVGMLGNLDGLRQVLASKLDNFYFNTWTPSRVIWDYMPFPEGGGVRYRWVETINEFPMFSFVLADLHPHVMSLPFILIVIAAALNLLLAPVGSAVFSLKRAEGIFSFILLALSIGALYFMNTWDYPTFFLLVILAVAVRELKLGAQETPVEGEPNPKIWQGLMLGGKVADTLWARLGRWFGFVVRLGVVSLALYLPFHLTFVSLVGNAYIPEGLDQIPVLSSLAKLILVVAWDRTPLYGYLLIFGVFVLPMLTFLAIKVYPYLKAPYAYLDEIEAQPYVKSNLGLQITVGGLFILFVSIVMNSVGVVLGVTLTTGILAVPVIAVGVGFMAYDFLARVRPARLGRELQLALLLIMVILIALGWYVRFELYGVLIICGVTAGLLLWFENKTKQDAKSDLMPDNFALLLIIIPVTISFTIEIIFLRDIFSYRINTLFKFYYQAWLMYGLAAAFCSWRVIAWAWRREPLAQTEYREQSSLLYDTVGEMNPVGATSMLQLEERVGTTSVSRLAVQRSPLVVGDTIAFSMGYNSGNTVLDEPDFAEDALWEIEQRGREEAQKTPWWRWLWVFGLGLLVMGGLVYTIFAPYEATRHFSNRIGLDGTSYIQNEYPGVYDAIQWMRQRLADSPANRGVIVEAEQGDYADWSIFGTFTGYPSLMGWSGHERQWRGGRQSILDEVGVRTAAVEEIYSTTDVSRAQALLNKYNVRYVIVGPFETGQLNPGGGFGQQPKNYSRPALAKFSTFMKVIYNKDGVIIYERG